MKRKYFRGVVMGGLRIGWVRRFSCCKEQDDEISNLEEEIDCNGKGIERIENLIKGGGVVRGVRESSDGISVKVSDGK